MLRSSAKGEGESERSERVRGRKPPTLPPGEGDGDFLRLADRGLGGLHFKDMSSLDPEHAQGFFNLSSLKGGEPGCPRIAVQG